MISDISDRPPLRIGIVGPGNVLEAYLRAADRLRAQGLAEVAAICGPERRRERALRAAPGVEFSSEYGAFLERRDIDIVVILTPMAEHAPMARAALEAGKHVLVEKPMAVTLEEGRDLLAVASRRKVHLVPAPFTILSPTFRAIAGRIRRGEIGRVVSARGRYGWAGPDWAEWFYRPGGGAIFDLGVYNLTTLTGLLGPVRRVVALTGVAVPERTVCGRAVRAEAEDNAHILLDFGEGRLAAVTTGFSIQQYRGPAVELYGTEGTIQLLGDDWDPDGYEVWMNAAGCWQRYKETAPDWPWTDGLRHLVECLLRGRKPLVTPEHAFHVLEVMVSAQESGRDGTARAVESELSALALDDLPAGVSPHRIHDRTRIESD